MGENPICPHEGCDRELKHRTFETPSRFGVSPEGPTDELYCVIHEIVNPEE